MSETPESILEALDAKAREYMRRIIRDMVEWRKREAELLSLLISRNARRLRERLSNYSLEPKVVWSPRAVVKGGRVELNEMEPYRFEMVWPRPSGLEHLYVDKVSVFTPNFVEKELTKDSKTVYKETIMIPGSGPIREEELPKFPYFDNLQLSPAELLRHVSNYISHVFVELIIDHDLESDYCTKQKIDNDYRYLCKPSSLLSIPIEPGEYTPELGVKVDFRFTPAYNPSVKFKSYKYHTIYVGDTILVKEEDGTIYMVVVDFCIYDGAYKEAEIGASTSTVYVPAHVLAVAVSNINSRVNIKYAALHVPGGLIAAKVKFQPPGTNNTNYVMAYDISHRASLEVVILGS